MGWVYERREWPAFRWDAAALAVRLADLHVRRTALLWAARSLSPEGRNELHLASLTSDVTTTSEIEGERLEPRSVRSSLARRLGLDHAGLPDPDRAVEGVVEMTLDAVRGWDRPLTPERLFDWHAALFPDGRSGWTPIRVGAWRDDSTGPMQIVSGPIHRPRAGYEAPPAERVPEEMTALLAWYADASVDPLVRAGIAHLWFETIHPFDDGNGRIGRAMVDHALARADGSALRVWSVSARILADRRGYSDALGRAQVGDLDATPWLDWFLARVADALTVAEGTISVVRRRSAFWAVWDGAGLNERQRRLVDRLLEGFHGKLTTGKWAKIARCSQDTATRDALDLVSRGILVRGPAGGRSTSYDLAAEWREAGTISSS